MDWGALVGPAVVAAAVSGIVSGIVSLSVARMNRSTSISLQAEKLEADRQLAERRFVFDKDLAERKFQSEQDRADWLRRNENYQEIIRRLPFLIAGRKEGDLNELLNETRKLWIVASPNLIKAVNEFESALETGWTRFSSLEEHLGALIIELRRDIALDSEGLSPKDFKIRSAKVANQATNLI